MEPEKHFGRTLPYTHDMRTPQHSLDVLYSAHADSLPRDIHDLQTTTAIINIPESINIEDLDVGMTIQHTWVRDLTIWLERDSIFLDTVVIRDSVYNPVDSTWTRTDTFLIDTSATVATVQLLDLFPGDSIVNMTDFWFDDDAGRGVYEALPPLTGGYRPLRSLDSMFVGHDAHGVWRLKVRDRYLFDEGSLQNFWLEINGVPSLSGTVTNAVNSSPVAGASIFVIDTTVIDTMQADSTGADTVAVGLTLTNGTYSISRIEQGSYRVVAAAVNFDAAFADVQIVTGQTTVQDFSLTTNSQFVNVTYRGDSILIPDLGRVEVPLVVSAQGAIQDLDVTITCASTWIAELTFTLENPDGDSITLFRFNPIPDLGDDMVDCRFDDEASQSFTSGTGPFTGSFRPMDSLAEFDGQEALGTWQLNAEDFGQADSGIFRSFTLHFQMAPAASDDPPISIPASFKLHPAYPNPFNANVSLSLDVTRTQDVQLQVFDITGRLVETLHSGKLNVGSHRFIWSPLTAASGMYFVRAYSQDLSQTIKVVLLK